MKYVPEPHHLMGIKHLVSGPHRALFAGMGLGKTGMTLAALDELFMGGRCKGALIVAPLRVCNLTWPNEVANWDDFCWMQVANLRTKEGMQAWADGSAQIYTINYEALPVFAAKHLVNRTAAQLPVDTLIWDELSRAKNPSSTRVNAIRKHWHKFERHWGLTGTPSPNSKLDMFAEYRLLDNGERLGSVFQEFRSKHFYAVDYDQRNWAMMKGQENVIESKVADMTLVLRSSDYLHIPDTEVIDVDVPLPDCARASYKQLAKELLLFIDEHVVNAVNSAVLVNKLTQITSGAVYTAAQESVGPDGEPTRTPGTTLILHDAKMKALAKICREQKGQPLMVTYQYKHEEERMRQHFKDAVFFSDATTNSKQQDLLAAWNAGMIPMLVVSPQSGGHGLNMQFGGSDIVWFSLSWSREYYDQLNARLARPGQENLTRIFRLICPKTMDDAVAEALRKKGDGQSALMDTIMNFNHLNDN
jgi:SNF2 family DNA or RNA helicase